MSVQRSSFISKMLRRIHSGREVGIIYSRDTSNRFNCDYPSYKSIHWLAQNMHLFKLRKLINEFIKNIYTKLRGMNYINQSES